MGSSIVSAAVPAVVGGLFGKKQKDPAETAAAYAAQGPSQTPEQKEASQYLFKGEPGTAWQGLTGWMKSPPKLTPQMYSPSQFTFGGGNAGTFSLANLGGAGGYQQPAQQSNFSMGAGGSAWPTIKSGQQQTNPPSPLPLKSTATGSSTAKPSGPVMRSTIGGNTADGANAAIDVTRTSNEVGIGDVGGKSVYVNRRQGADPSAGGGFYVTPSGVMMPYRGETQSWDQEKQQLTPDNQPSAQSDQQKPPETQEPWFNPQVQMQAQQGRTFNLPDLPEFQKLASQGQYQPGNLYTNELAQLMSALPGMAYGGYNRISGGPGLNLTDQIQRATAPITDMTGRIEGATAPITDMTRRIEGAAPRFGDLGTNENEAIVQERLRKGLDSNENLSFSDQYLKDLAARGIDPLKESFDLALKSATADYNRRGLFGSGFESGTKYGVEPDSITRNFMREVGNVQRDVALEGARQDIQSKMFNINRSDQMANALNQLAQTQQGRQRQDLSADIANEINKINMLQQQDLTNRGLAQQGINMLQQQDITNRGLAQQGVNMLTNQFQTNDASNRAWTQMDEDSRRNWTNMLNQTAQQDKGNLLSGIQTGANLAQQNEGNRQWWGDFINRQNLVDQANLQNRWQNAFDVAKLMGNREDEAQMFNIGQDTKAQQYNIEQIQQGISNLINFINGQGSAANNMQQNWQAGLDAGNKANALTQQQNAGMASAIGNIFAQAMQPKSPVSFNSGMNTGLMATAAAAGLPSWMIKT